MSQTFTDARGTGYETFTEVVSYTTILSSPYKGLREVECAYVRPCGAAPDGMFIPVLLVQQMLDDDLIWLNEPPDNDEPIRLWDLGISGETESREELRNLRTIEARIYADFLATN